MHITTIHRLLLCKKQTNKFPFSLRKLPLWTLGNVTSLFPQDEILQLSTDRLYIYSGLRWAAYSTASQRDLTSNKTRTSLYSVQSSTFPLAFKGHRFLYASVMCVTQCGKISTDILMAVAHKTRHSPNLIYASSGSDLILDELL